LQPEGPVLRPPLTCMHSWMFLYSVSFSTLGKESKLFIMVPRIMSSVGSRTWATQVTDGHQSGNQNLMKSEIIATEWRLQKSHFFTDV
jgi:hypothetical protein